MRQPSISWPIVCGVTIVCIVSSGRISAQTSLSLKNPAELAAEEQILRALEEPASINVVETPLKDVMERIHKEHGINIQLDIKSLTDAGITLDTPMTRSVANVRLRSALDLMLEDHEMGWIIADDALIITSVTRVKEHVETRVYPVRDLDEMIDEQGIREDYDSLIDTITSNIAPTTWTESGGTGLISAFPNARALVVTQTRPAHEQLELLLAKLRVVRAEQGVSIARDDDRRAAFRGDVSDDRDDSEIDDPQPPPRAHSSAAQPAWRIPKVYR